MKKHIQKIALIGLTLLLAACGEPVPQNKLALVVKTLGARDTDASTTAEIVWAQRLQFGASANPGMRIYRFPLGMQDYGFNSKPSYESPTDQGFKADCLGGTLTFDVNIQLYLDRKTPDLAKKLLAFISDFQMTGYNGEPDMLAKWAGEKLPSFLRGPIQKFTLNKQAIDVMRDKEKIDKDLLDAMNERFNRYGIFFTTIGITSPINPPEDQKKKMWEVVMKEYNNQKLELQKTDLMPLLTQINMVEQDGLLKVQQASNFGETESIRIQADAMQQRRQKFISLVGEDNYIALEQMLTLVKGLDGSDTKIRIVPKSLSYIGGGFVPPAKAATPAPADTSITNK